MKVCPRCGRTEKEVPFIGFLCRDCYLATHQVIRVPRLILKRCPTCGRIFTGRWQEYSLEAIRAWVKRHVRADLDEAFVSVGFSGTDDPERIRVTILAFGSIRGVSVRVQKTVDIPVVYEQCPDCARRAAGYYEAIIQLRGEDPERALDAIYRWIRRIRGEGAYVSKEVRRKEGIDVYVGSRKVAEKLAGKLVKFFGASMKRSFTLITEKNGKKIYRETIAVRLPGRERKR